MDVGTRIFCTSTRMVSSSSYTNQYYWTFLGSRRVDYQTNWKEIIGVGSMIEIAGNLLTVHERGHCIVVPTNGTVKRDGACVMGRGIALEIKKKHPSLAFWLGNCISRGGNQLYHNEEYNIITFPVKHKWQEDASLDLIRNSSSQLLALWKTKRLDEVYLPRVGCGNGNRDWQEVKPILDSYLESSSFILVSLRRETV